MSEIKQVWGIIKDYKCADLKMVQDPALAVFQHQQAKIEKLENELSTTKQVLGNVIDMEVAKVDNLKAQLNNMEACYIGKKKINDEQSAIIQGHFAARQDMPMKKGDRVKVDFISESRTIYSGKRFTGYGVLDRVEDGRVYGRLDDGTPFMCLCADVEVIER